MIKRYDMFEALKHNDIDPYGEEDWSELPYQYETSIDVGEPVVIPQRRNTYKVVISNMHGDADHYSKTTTITDNKDEVIKIINFCKWCNDGWANRRDLAKIGEKVFGSYDDFSELVDYDATTDNQVPCRPSISKVTYFDNEGIEHAVRINSKKIKSAK